MNKKYAMYEITDMKEVGKNLLGFSEKLDSMVVYFTGRGILDENVHWEEVNIAEGLRLAEELFRGIESICDVINPYYARYGLFSETITEEELDILAKILNEDERP